jgi:hypothetical protein
MCIVIVWQVLGLKAFVHMVVLHSSMKGRLRAVRLSLSGGAVASRDATPDSVTVALRVKLGTEHLFEANVQR